MIIKEKQQKNAQTKREKDFIGALVKTSEKIAEQKQMTIVVTAQCCCRKLLESNSDKYMEWYNVSFDNDKSCLCTLFPSKRKLLIFETDKDIIEQSLPFTLSDLKKRRYYYEKYSGDNYQI